MTTFVLVHGTGHGGWCWGEVAGLLSASGAEVYAPTLSGVGDRFDPASRDADLTTHTADIIDLLLGEDLRDVTLVGHSYGGTVITAVAAVAPERLRMLVYLDAYVPDAGQSQLDLWPAEMRAEIQVGALADRGFRSPPTPEVLGITDPALASWVRTRITPHPLAAYREPVPEGDARSAALPRAYIRCSQGPMTSLLEPFAEKARSRGWAYQEIASGHDAMLIAPREVAQALLELVDQVA